MGKLDNLKKLLEHSGEHEHESVKRYVDNLISILENLEGNTSFTAEEKFYKLSHAVREITKNVKEKLKLDTIMPSSLQYQTPVHHHHYYDTHKKENKVVDGLDELINEDGDVAMVAPASPDGTLADLGEPPKIVFGYVDGKTPKKKKRKKIQPIQDL